jgi:hypothetical protein
MTAATEVAQRVASSAAGHPVISLYLDLDPERFATPPARATQIRSLIDRAARGLEADGSIEHEDRVALRGDLERIDAFLTSREAPVSGAQALALFCSGPQHLFEVVPLRHSVQGEVTIDTTPRVEPLVSDTQVDTWCVALTNRRTGRIFSGPADSLAERERIEGEAHGQHRQGGWSQANYERSVEHEAEENLRAVAHALHRYWQRHPFQRLALGGPPEAVPRLAALLHEDLRGLLVEGRVEVDVSSATDDQVQAATAPLVAAEAERRARQVLGRLETGLATGDRAVAGIADTVRALNERRVETLLLDGGSDWEGARCSTCGLLVHGGDGNCPADGTKLEPVRHLRDAAIQAALLQDAAVQIADPGEPEPAFERRGGIAAVLRF